MDIKISNQIKDENGNEGFIKIVCFNTICLRRRSMKISALLFTVIFAQAMVAMDKAPNPISTLRGTVATNGHGGYLECEVTHDKKSDTYSGTLYNRHYSIAEWFSQGLDQEEAQTYYQQLQQAAAAKAVAAAQEQEK